ncbi:hypothetical protein PV325_005300 [Microctonus aethiopoides]|nr:hypothetical protein PV325_005300 [Microctonus aethiopoides]
MIIFKCYKLQGDDKLIKSIDLSISNDFNIETNARDLLLKIKLFKVYGENMKDEIKVLHAAGKKNKKLKPVEKYITQEVFQNEMYYTIQALIFTIFIFMLSYYGIRYGCMEYNLLDNGNIINGFVPPRKAVVTVSVGYSIPYAIVYSISACMLLYSIILSRPRWSLPLIIISISDIVCNIGDAFVAFWLLFTRLTFYTAITYMASASSILIGELWIWFGILRLYELKMYDS